MIFDILSSPLLSKCLLSTCYVPDSVLGAEDSRVGKKHLSAFTMLTDHGEGRLPRRKWLFMS